MPEFSIIFAVGGAAVVILVVGKVLRRRALKRLVQARFHSGLCIMCGADLRFGKEQCRKCGYKYDTITAMVWDDMLQRQKAQEDAGGDA